MKTIKEIKDHFSKDEIKILIEIIRGCLLYTSDAADEP